MGSYRAIQPPQPVFPKLHYLEDHVIDFIRQWKAGPGLLGEHGGESVHARFNNLQQRYSSMSNVSSRLLQIMRFHSLEVCPARKDAPRPAKKKKKK